MARFVRNDYTFEATDGESIVLAIRNLKRYITELGGRRAELYAERMAYEGERYANELLSGGLSEEVWVRNSLKDGEEPDDSIELDAFVYGETGRGLKEGRKTSWVVMEGRDAPFVEFGAGVTKNAGVADHPKRAEAGMSPIGTYGMGRGSQSQWRFVRDGGKYWTQGFRQTQVLYKTSDHLKKVSGSIAKTAFNAKNP